MSQQSEYTQILYRVTDEVCRVTLNRPHLRNAQSLQLLDELRAAFKRAGEDDAVKVIILDGAGPSFSSGHDLGSPEEQADRERRGIVDSMAGRYKLYQEKHLEVALDLRRCPKPTIAKVSGYCIFGGFLIASAMDLIVASDDAQFLPTQLALFSAPWDLGVRGAKEVLYRGTFMPAAEAASKGLVSHVVPLDELERRTLEIARDIAEAHTVFQLRMLKESINAAQDQMGYETAARQGYLYYFMGASERRDSIGAPELGERPRLDGVDYALTKLRAQRAEQDAPVEEAVVQDENLATPQNPAKYEDIPRMVGLRRRTQRLTVTKEMCQAFEQATLLHDLFPDIIARRPPGVQIVEGFLSLSMLDALVGTALRYDSETLQTLNYGINRHRFVRPVWAPVEMFADFTVVAVRPKGSAYLMDYRCEMRQGEGDGELFNVTEWTIHVSQKGGGHDVVAWSPDS